MWLGCGFPLDASISCRPGYERTHRSFLRLLSLLLLFPFTTFHRPAHRRTHAFLSFSSASPRFNSADRSRSQLPRHLPLFPLPPSSSLMQHSVHAPYTVSRSPPFPLPPAESCTTPTPRTPFSPLPQNTHTQCCANSNTYHR